MKKVISASVTVNSSQMESLSWEDDTLTVVFKGGAKYVYSDVPADVFQEIIASDSLGSAFNRLIKKGGYKFEKIDNTMTFGEAIDYLKQNSGGKVARKGWNGKAMFIFLVNGSTFKVNRPPLNEIYEEGTEINYQPHIDMKTADDTIVPWLASQSDVLALDWEVVQ